MELVKSRYLHSHREVAAMTSDLREAKSALLLYVWLAVHDALAEDGQQRRYALYRKQWYCDS